MEARLRASFEAQGMMRTIKASMTSAERGRVAIEAPVTPQTSQQHGFGHAALAFAIGDSAAGYAALSVMEEGDEVLTVEMKINLLAPARGPVLRAEGRVIRAGRRLVVVSAEVADTHGAVAVLQGTMIPVPANPR